MNAADIAGVEPTEVQGLFQAAIWYLSPFAAFYLGIFIKWHVYRDRNAPKLFDQLLLGIPVSLIVVATYLTTYQLSYQESTNAFLVTLGIMIFNGMIVTETATRWLASARAQISPLPRGPQ